MIVPKADLEAVLALLDESKRLHEGGHYEAHEVAEKAREMLYSLINKEMPDGSKSAT